MWFKMCGPIKYVQVVLAMMRILVLLTVVMISLVPIFRYGETNIRHVNQTLRRDEWKKGGRMHPNENRPLPTTPREHVEPPRAVHKERNLYQNSEIQTDRSMTSSLRSRPPRPSAPVSADFFVSVPIFNETLSHR